jgi:N-acetylglutamate synthase-like GNAT family acetyltransferase
MKVTTPQQARELRLAQKAGDVARLVAVIEVAVLEEREEHWIDIRGFSPAAVQYVKGEYEDAGWRVRIEHDARDGDALVLAP